MTNGRRFRPINTLLQSTVSPSSPRSGFRGTLSRPGSELTSAHLPQTSDSSTQRHLSTSPSRTLVDGGQPPRKKRRKGRRSDRFSLQDAQRDFPDQEDELAQQSSPTNGLSRFYHTIGKPAPMTIRQSHTFSPRTSFSDSDGLLKDERHPKLRPQDSMVDLSTSTLRELSPPSAEPMIITKSVALHESQSEEAHNGTSLYSLENIHIDHKTSHSKRANRTSEADSVLCDLRVPSTPKEQRNGSDLSGPTAKNRDGGSTDTGQLEHSQPKAKAVGRELLASGLSDATTSTEVTSRSLQRALNDVRQSPRQVALDKFPIRFIRHGNKYLAGTGLELIASKDHSRLCLLAHGDTSEYTINMSQIQRIFHAPQGSGTLVYIKLRGRIEQLEHSSQRPVLIDCKNTEIFARFLVHLEVATGVRNSEKSIDWLNKAFEQSESKMVYDQDFDARVTSLDQRMHNSDESAQVESVKRLRRSEGKVFHNLKDASGKRSIPNDFYCTELSVTGSRATVPEAGHMRLRSGKNRLGHFEKRTISSHTRHANTQIDQNPSGLVRQTQDPEDTAMPYSQYPGLGKPWSRALTFPNQGKHKVTVEFDDLLRLDEGEYLNDNLVQFYLRFLQANMERSDVKTASRVYWFNSYFFPTLTSGKGKRVNFEAIRRWTRNVDLFQYQYVVVPINESAHWYLVILCNLPELLRGNSHNIYNAADGAGEVEAGTVFDYVFNGDGQPQFHQKSPSLLSGNQLLPGATAEALMSEEANSQSPPNPADPDPAERASTPLAIGDSTSSGANINRHTSHGKSLSTEDSFTIPLPASESSVILADALINDQQTPRRASDKKRRPPLHVLSPNTPAIITFDSLGQIHPGAHRALKEYLVEEALDKKGLASFDVRSIKGINVKGIPQQENLCDCGLYLLGYVDKFVDDPQAFVSKALAKEFDALVDWPKLQPSLMRNQMRNLLFELHAEDAVSRQARSLHKKRLSKVSDATVSSERAQIQSSQNGLLASENAPAHASRNENMSEAMRDLEMTTRGLGGRSVSELTARLNPQIYSDVSPRFEPIDHHKMPSGSVADALADSTQPMEYRKAATVQRQEQTDDFRAQLIDAVTVVDQAGAKREIIDLCT